MTRCSFCHILDWNGRIPYIRKVCCGDKKLCRNSITLLLEQAHALIRPFGIIEQAVFAEPYMNRFVQEREETPVCCVCCVYKDERCVRIYKRKGTKLSYIKRPMCIRSDLAACKYKNTVLREHISDTVEISLCGRSFSVPVRSECKGIPYSLCNLGRRIVEAATPDKGKNVRLFPFEVIPHPVLNCCHLIQNINELTARLLTFFTPNSAIFGKRNILVRRCL